MWLECIGVQGRIQEGGCGGCNPPFHKELLRLEASWITLSLYAQCCYVRRHRKQSDAVHLSLVTLTKVAAKIGQNFIWQKYAAFPGLGPEPRP